MVCEILTHNFAFYVIYVDFVWSHSEKVILNIK